MTGNNAPGTAMFAVSTARLLPEPALPEIATMSTCTPKACSTCATVPENSIQPSPAGNGATANPWLSSQAATAATSDGLFA